MKTFVLQDYLALAVAAAAIAGVTGYLMGAKEKDSAKAPQSVEEAIPSSLQSFKWSGSKDLGGKKAILEFVTENGVYCVAIRNDVMQCDFSKRIPPAEFSKAFSFGAVPAGTTGEGGNGGAGK